MTMCSNCKERPSHSFGRCQRCYDYHKRTGEERPEQVAILSMDDLVEIVARYVNYGTPLVEMSDDYGVSLSTLHYALSGKTKQYRGLENRVNGRHLTALLAYRKRYGARKLTPAQARTIRAAYADGKSQRVLAVTYEVSVPAISRLVRGHTYREAGGSIAPTMTQRRAKR